MAELGIQTVENLRNLSALLKPKDESSDDEDTPDHGPAAFTPASINSSKKKEKPTQTPYEKSDANNKDIWGEEEVPELSVFADENETRKQPEYEILYKQKVTSEDMFLGMGGKNPSSACCEAMIIKIQLPQCKIKDVELDVKETFLDCRSPTYRLLLSLPHPVEPKTGNAKWDGAKELLEVSLTMKREYDFINFQ